MFLSSPLRALPTHARTHTRAHAVQVGRVDRFSSQPGAPVQANHHSTWRSGSSDPAVELEEARKPPRSFFAPGSFKTATMAEWALAAQLARVQDAGARKSANKRSRTLRASIMYSARDAADVGTDDIHEAACDALQQLIKNRPTPRSVRGATFQLCGVETLTESCRTRSTMRVSMTQLQRCSEVYPPIFCFRRLLTCLSI